MIYYTSRILFNARNEMNFTLCDNTGKITDMFASKLILLFVCFSGFCFISFCKSNEKDCPGGRV